MKTKILSLIFLAAFSALAAPIAPSFSPSDSTNLIAIRVKTASGYSEQWQSVSNFFKSFPGVSALSSDYAYSPDLTAKYLFSPHLFFTEGSSVTNTVNVTDGAIWLDTTVVGNGNGYLPLGPSATNSIVDITFTPVADNTNGLGNSFPWSNYNEAHYGAGARMVDNNNFAGLFMVSARDSSIQLDDRTNSTERVTIYHLPPGSIQFGQSYRLQIINTNGNTAIYTLWNSAGTILTNLTYTFTVGVPDAGYPFAHTFSSQIKITDCTVYDKNWTKLVAANSMPWAAVSTGTYPLPVVTNNTFVLSGTNGWNYNLVPHAITDFKMAGSIKPANLRVGGLLFRSDPSARYDYQVYFDTNHNWLAFVYHSNSVSTTVATTAFVAQQSQWMPFTFTAVGQKFSLNLNGTNFTFTGTNNYNSGLTGFAAYSGDSLAVSNFALTSIKPAYSSVFDLKTTNAPSPGDVLHYDGTTGKGYWAP